MSQRFETPQQRSTRRLRNRPRATSVPGVVPALSTRAWLVLVLLVLFVGDPDLHDAIVKWLTGCP